MVVGARRVDVGLGSDPGGNTYLILGRSLPKLPKAEGCAKRCAKHSAKQQPHSVTHTTVDRHIQFSSHLHNGHCMTNRSRLCGATLGYMAQPTQTYQLITLISCTVLLWL